MESNSNKKIVLIADFIVEKSVGNLELDRGLEKSDYSTVDFLLSTLKKIGYKVTHYQTPQELAENAHLHLDATVISIYGGESSRNRMSLVPAICETFNIDYIGPDVYGRIIAQDKEVSKRLAREFGIDTPEWIIIRSKSDFSLIKKINFPIVVKPLLEGSSIGISQANLCHNIEQAISITSRLLEEFKQPVLIEEFIAGKEAALSVIESRNGFDYAFSEIYIPSEPYYFDTRLFDAQEKVNPSNGRTVVNIDTQIPNAQIDKILNFLEAFGKFGYCRVDGKFFEEKFYFLELTPDAWIDPSGQFSKAFTEKGWSYEQVIQGIINSAQVTPQDQ